MKARQLIKTENERRQAIEAARVREVTELRDLEQRRMGGQQQQNAEEEQAQ